MKVLKGFMLAFCFVNLSVSFGQKWHFGPDLGGNLILVEEDAFGNDFQPRFNVGALVTYDFKDYFGLRTGVYFTQKTHSYFESYTSLLNLFGLEDQIPAGANADLNIYEDLKSRTTQYYVEMPLLAYYRYSLFTAYLGPYFGYMVFARSKTETITNVPLLQAIDVSALDPTGTLGGFLPAPYSYSFVNGSSKKDLNPWDIGLRAGFGMEFQRVGVNIFYNYGLTDYRTKVQTGDLNGYNYFQASVNYNFSCKVKHSN